MQFGFLTPIIFLAVTPGRRVVNRPTGKQRKLLEQTVHVAQQLTDNRLNKSLFNPSRDVSAVSALLL